jgi:hypothetical protein
LESARNILEALEYPVYGKLPSVTKRAWECYLEDRGQHFHLNYLKLLTAEAWLEVDSRSQHGGKRC